jgi:hypothetical protein
MAVDTVNTTNSTYTQKDIDNFQTTYDSAQSEAEAKVKELNGLKLTDKDGKTVECKTVDEWMTAFKERGPLKYTSGNYVLGGPNDKNSVSNLCKQVCDKLNNAQQNLEVAKGQFQSMKAMDDLLQSGDLMGALFLLCSTRSNNMQDSLSAKIKAMQERNNNVQQMNIALGQQYAKNPRDDGTIKQIEGNISKANSDSQLEMIQVNDLVTKKNQAMDMLSNLTNKFSQTMSNIIGNMGR